MNRRAFLASAVAPYLAGALSAANAPLRRAAIIGHTGRGNYGHKLDVVWQKIPNVEIVGVADADPEGLKKAMARLGTHQGFSDYRKMHESIQPEFVSVAPRHVDQHLEMALAAIEAGASGLYVEKPFCRTPSEADQLIAAAEKKGAKIAVAHRNRYHPVLPVIKRLLADGAIGRLLEIRANGKGDRRGGSEDLWVLGSHVLNLFQYFGGDPETCSTTVLQNGKLATSKDVTEGPEGLGLLAGDEVHAQWHLSSGLVASYKSFANDGSKGKGYAAHLIGTNGMITLEIDANPLAWLIPGSPANPASREEARIPIFTAGLGEAEPHPETITQVQNHVLAVQDLIDSVDSDRPPLCDAHQGAMAVEMICSVFESHRQGGARVPFPLTERGNPWAKF